MKQQRIEIVTGEKRIPEIVPVVQRDSGRELHCLITDLKIPAGAVARIYARKPSGKEIYNDCTVLGNTVVVKLTTQMLAETGKVTCQVEISEESSKVSSFAFLLSVEERIDSGSAIESTDEFTALENALWEVEEAAENANAAAGEANKIADTVQQKLDNGEFVGPQGLPGVVDKDTPVEFVQGTEYALPSSGETLGRIIGKTAGDIAILKSGMDSAYILDRINPVTSGSLNDYATPGVYTCINSTIGENITDQPDGKPKAGFKVVVEYVGYPNMILQTITYQGSLLHTYRRIRYDGVWKPWYGGPNNQWDAIGKLADLQTAEKGSLVGAINSVNSDITAANANIAAAQTRASATAPARTVWQESGSDLNVYIDKGLDRTMLMICASDGTVSYYPVIWTAATTSLQTLTEIELGSRSQAAGYVKDSTAGRYRIKIESNTTVSRGVMVMICDTSASFVG